MFIKRYTLKWWFVQTVNKECQKAFIVLTADIHNISRSL